VVPAGGRTLHVNVEGPGVKNTGGAIAGLTSCALFRDASMIQEWDQKGINEASTTALADRPERLNMVAADAPVAGTYTYSFQYRTVTGFGGTSTVLAGASKPTAIQVTEI